MLDWLRFIGEFLLTSIKSILNLIPMLTRALGLIHLSMAISPPFLLSIMTLMLCVIIVMWLVNIL